MGMFPCFIPKGYIKDIDEHRGEVVWGVTEDFLVMRRMVLVYKPLMKTHQQLLNKYKALSEAEREVLRQVIESLEVQMEEVARMIVGEAGKRYPAYNRLADELGVHRNIKALAELITYIDPSKGFRKKGNLRAV